MGGRRREHIEFDGIDERHKVSFSVSQRTYKPKRLEDGSYFYPWQVTLHYWAQVGVDDDGHPVLKRRQLGHTCKDSVKTEKGARVAATKWLAELRDEQERAEANVAQMHEREEAQRKAEEERRKRAAKLTVWQCVDQYIEESLAGGFIESSTAQDYRNTAKRIRATLEDRPADELTAEDVEEWTRRLRKTHAYSTIKKTRNVLRSSIDYAKERGRVDIRENPVPRSRKTIEEKRRGKLTAPKLNYLDKAGRTVLLEELRRAEPSPVTIAGQIALYEGLREAEVCALRWRDITFDKQGGTLTVDKTIGKTPGGLYVKPPKGLEEDRVLPLAPELRETLWDWRSRCIEIARSVDSNIDIQETFVIGDPTRIPPAECFDFERGTDRNANDGKGEEKLLGNPDVYPTGVLSPYLLGRKWKTVAELSRARGQLGKPVSFHNLRHTFGFYMAREVQGVSKETLARWLGHKSTVTTERYYVASDRRDRIAEDRRTFERISEAGIVSEGQARVLTLDRTGTDT